MVKEKETDEKKSGGCCGAYCSEVCDCGSIAWYASKQEKAQEGMNGEIVMVASMRSNADRTEYIESVAKVRGKDSALKLRRDVWAYMQANKASA